jgi:hypothetical protein
MKLTFFLIALFLILARICFPMAHLWHHGNNEGTMVMSGDHFYEAIKWSGKIKLSDDERALASITPGGYLEFQLNDSSLNAESDLQGEITYTLFDGKTHLTLTDSGKQFIAVQLQRMIAFGFFADGRAERIYQKGGNKALLAELTHIKMGNREDYFNLLFKSDSLTNDEWIGLLAQIDSTGDDNERGRYLNHFTAAQLRDSVIGFRWLASVGRINRDDIKKDLLLQYVGRDSTDSAGLSPNRFDSVLAVGGHMESGDDKQRLYQQLIRIPEKTEEEWIGLIRVTARIDREDIKSALLQQIARKMPKNETGNKDGNKNGYKDGNKDLRAEFMAAAKSIKDDMEYGRLMRAVDY